MNDKSTEIEQPIIVNHKLIHTHRYAHAYIQVCKYMSTVKSHGFRTCSLRRGEPPENPNSARRMRESESARVLSAQQMRGNNSVFW